ncbi:serine/threonine-protein phosphatase 4 regulatory subunit 2 [Drosophila subpulchrella]|uniref:serine/threonine-protein phosphatase 4 regulatory subunit 2 n=1 Tax=Drosophila subpulchrella TaxID=1486046 RepID=UPI0018A1A553|nr:serine/threonine-protein phosphatase 4 regulatory subunit 2 [Drosophila subpulchrella]
MVTMENSDEILQILERFTRLKQKEIPKELEDYLQYVAKTGDTIFKWSSLKYLFREKLLNVIKHFNEDSPRLEEIPNYPNVDPFNYETMKSSLLERLDLFNAAPFTIQRLCELLIDPRKQYSRIDKFMRALEKNILVVSTIEPGRKRTESENGDSLDSVVNGDLSLEVNIDIEMENEALFNNGNAEEGSAPSSGSAGGAQKVSCPRSDDNEQPKAKKAKLEIGEEPSEATDDVPAEPEEEVASKAKKDKEEKGDNDETDSPQEAAEIEEPDEEVEEAEPEAKTTKQDVNGSKKESEQGGSSPASADEEVEDPMLSKSPEAEKEPATKEKEELDKKETAGTPKDIVKKTEAEKADKSDDKVEQPDDKQAGDKATPPAEAEKEEPAKAKAEKEKEEGEKRAPVAADKQEEKKAAETEAAPADKPAEEKTAPAESKPKTKSEAKPEADAKESQPEKTETEPAKESLPEEKESAEPAAKAEEKKEGETTSEAVKETAEESQDGEASSPAVEDLGAATTPQSPLGAADSAAETPPADSAADDSQASPLAAVTPPTLALNDQPMEDTPAEEDARVSPSAAVDEVMAESGPAAEMATEEAAAKDEPAAMEVDDTSQEVMDQ